MLLNAPIDLMWTDARTGTRMDTRTDGHLKHHRYSNLSNAVQPLLERWVARCPLPPRVAGNHRPVRDFRAPPGAKWLVRRPNALNLLHQHMTFGYPKAELVHGPIDALSLLQGVHLEIDRPERFPMLGVNERRVIVTRCPNGELHAVK